MVATLPDNCPPTDARPVDQRFLRFVSGTLSVGDVPDKLDWVLPHENAKSTYYGRIEDCSCHAHSLFSNPADIDVARKFVPMFRKKRVAALTITQSMGVVAHTPARIGRSHHSWWPAPADLVPTASVIA